MKRGRLFVMSAPAGTGKTTLVNRLTKERSNVVESISCTTRPPRPDEVDGEHYHFVTQEAFNERLAGGDFLEHAEVFGNHYGTSKREVNQFLDRGLHVVLVIDTQGAMQVKKTTQCTTIFLIPPSMEELERRLKQRRTETTAQRKLRLSWAKTELAQIPLYDVQIVNDDLDTAFTELDATIC